MIIPPFTLTLSYYRYIRKSEFVLYLLLLLSIAIIVALNDTFVDIIEARKAINRHVLNDSESYQVYKTDTRRYILLCKDKDCSFTIRA